MSNIIPFSNENAENNDDDDDGRPVVVDTDPTGRFERYEECLGIGAYKEVFKAFDQEEAVEVAWCQLKASFSGRKDVEKILNEISILQSLRCENVINFYASWAKKGSDGRDHIIFITELMTSGTLKQYIKRTKGLLKPKLLKQWARQILKGLNYLHTRNPPIIHRDLKCDNIFINGNNGQAKIGDLGLAIIKNRDHVSSVLGTVVYTTLGEFVLLPEFMAPELYEEKYNEKVDIYAFGMCILELVSKEYPYSECNNQAQIFRKVTSGIRPQALDKIKDPKTLEFVELCLRFDPNERPSAAELLEHEFLREDPKDSVSMINEPIAVSEQTQATSPLLSVSYDQNTPETLIATISPPNPQIIQHSTTETITNETAKVKAQSDNTNIEPYDQKKQLPPPNLSIATKTIDAESKTYQVRSATFPPPRHAQQLITDASVDRNVQGEDLFKCDVKIVEKLTREEVTLKMTITEPGQPEMEIKFPFNLEEDTIQNVVAEMVRESILKPEGQMLAQRKIEDIVRQPLLLQSQESYSSLPRSRTSSIHGQTERFHDGAPDGSSGTTPTKVTASANGFPSPNYYSDISSSYGSMELLQTTSHHGISSSVESLPHTSSTRPSWEKEADDEVRKVLSRNDRMNDSFLQPAGTQLTLPAERSVTESVAHEIPVQSPSTMGTTSRTTEDFFSGHSIKRRSSSLSSALPAEVIAQQVSSSAIRPETVATAVGNSLVPSMNEPTATESLLKSPLRLPARPSSEGTVEQLAIRTDPYRVQELLETDAHTGSNFVPTESYDSEGMLVIGEPQHVRHANSSGPQSPAIVPTRDDRARRSSNPLMPNFSIYYTNTPHHIDAYHMSHEHLVRKMPTSSTGSLSSVHSIGALDSSIVQSDFLLREHLHPENLQGTIDGSGLKTGVSIGLGIADAGYTSKSHVSDLRERQRRETQELQAKHEQEWAVLIHRRKMRHKSPHVKATSSVGRSAISPLMHRPVSEMSDHQVGSTSSVSSTSSHGDLRGIF
ncbi:8891_t:CDS:2 [Paraglomus occultum]|uniref:8891_t:CDS:1 n=1 Tax=Paraglomus occultum TaxID=144539 RepID=A0A9N8VRA2_9GLOM|nr:8891_t:CDS:2 [Paraglomus occultum]